MSCVLSNAVILKPKPQDTKMKKYGLQEGALINGMTAPSRTEGAHVDVSAVRIQLQITYSGAESPDRDRPWSWMSSKFPLFISHWVYSILTAAGMESDRTLGWRVQQRCN